MTFNMLLMKTIDNDSDISESELDIKIGLIDLLIKVNNLYNVNDIKGLVLEIEKDYIIIYIHRYINEKITTFGIKTKNKKKKN